MKYCETCHSIYPNELDSCPKDKESLRQANDLMPGMIIRDKYEVLEKIGIGGMAAVYKSRHLTFNEIRAIKVVSSKLLGDQDFLKRFKNEAIITRKLTHPNAVHLDDFDTTEDGRPFIVMEYVQGRNLRSWIHGTNPLPIPRALNIGKQIASALGAAHKLNIVHRDIKPDNVLLVPQPAQLESTQDLVKVLDFGIAKMADGSFEGNRNATQTGMVVGTPQYVSPEQASGKIGDQIDGRSDLYSLGIVLYEMITGKLPFHSDTPIGYLIHHLQTAPTPPPGVVQSVSSVIMKALEKDRSRRYQSADEMISAMDRALKSPIPPPVRPVATPVTPITPTAIPGPKPAMAAAPITQRAQPLPATSAQPQRNVAVLTPPAPATTTGTYVAEAGGTVFDETKLRRGRPAASSGASFDVKKLLIIASVVLGLVVVVYAIKQWQSNHNALSEQTAQDDARILQDVNDTLSQADFLKNVHAEVKKGIVTLTGTVTKSYEAEAAVNKAHDVLGVRSVVNNIQVPQSTEQHDAVWRSEQEKNSSNANPQPNNVRPAPTPAPPPSGNPSTGNPGTAVRPNRAAALQYVQQGYTQIGMRDYQGAVGSFQHALALDPGNQAALNGLQKARAARKGN
jgi:serine/threonine-protein kinase